MISSPAREGRRVRRTIPCLPLFLTSCLWAQSSPAGKAEQSTMADVQKILVSGIDARLPKVTLEFVLNYESEGSPIRWEVNDCGEQTGKPSADPGRNFTVCVEADFDLHHRSVSVSNAVGTSNRGNRATPGFFSGTIPDPERTSHSIPKLGDLPAQLRRLFPRQARDLPNAVGAL